MLLNHVDALGFEASGFLLWLADALLVLAVASAVHVRFVGARRGAARTALSVGILSLAVVTLSALGLGFARVLSSGGFLISHLALVAALPLLFEPARWTHGARQAGAALGQVGREVVGALARAVGPSASWPVRLLVVAIVLLLGAALLLGALTPPANDDTLAYRLPRITWWLQEARLGHNPDFDLLDQRRNYTAFGSDLVMLWTASFFSLGFPLAKLPQLAGGVLAAAGTFSLALRVGLGRAAALAAVVVLLGMPNVTVQLVTTQTDLYTAGCAAALLVFLVDASGSGRTIDWALTGLALGLAVGAKGTLFYWAPGLALLVLALVWLDRPPLRTVVRAGIVVGVVTLLLGSSAYVLNFVRYGDPFASPQARSAVHTSPTTSRADYAAFNGSAYLWQLLEPGSNPPFLEPGVGRAFQAIEERLAAWAEDDPPFAGAAGRFRREARTFHRDRPHENLVSIGVLAAVLALVGGLRVVGAARRPTRGHVLALALLISVVVFFAVFCLLQAWTAHKFRYFVLVCPVLALFAIRAFVSPDARTRPFAGALTVAAVSLQAFMAVLVLVEFLPGRVESPGVRRIDTALEFLGEEPLRLCLVQVSGHVLRRRVPHHYRFASGRQVAEAGRADLAMDALGCDAMLLDRKRLVGQLGRVKLSPRAPRGSLVAVRPAAPGERPDALCVQARGLQQNGWLRARARVRFEGWSRPTMTVRLDNQTEARRRVRIRTTEAGQVAVLESGEARNVEVPVASADRLRIDVSPDYRPAPRHGYGVQLTLPPGLDCGKGGPPTPE